MSHSARNKHVVATRESPVARPVARPVVRADRDAAAEQDASLVVAGGVALVDELGSFRMRA